MLHVVNQQKAQEEINKDFQNRFIDLTEMQVLTQFRGAVYETYRAASAEIDKYTDDLTNTCQSLANSKVPVRLFSEATLKAVYESFKQRAQELNCEIPLRNYHDILQFDVDHGYSEAHGTIRIWLTTGCVPHEDKVPLYELMPFPLMESIVEGYSMTPMVREKNLIAYTNTNQYREYSRVELSFCKLQYGIYICKDRNILRTDTDASCLAGLFMQNIDIVAEACIMEFSKPVEQIYGVEENTWLVHVPKPQTIQIRCGTKTGVDELVHVNGMGILRMEPGCSTRLGRFDISTDANPDEIGDMVMTDWRASPSNIYSHEELLDMIDRAEQLKKAEMEKFTTDDMKTLEMATDIKRTATLKIYIVFGLISLVFVAVSIFVFVFYRKFISFRTIMAGLIRAYHRSHHVDKPDIHEHDPVLHVPNFDVFYDRIVREGEQRMVRMAGKLPIEDKSRQVETNNARPSSRVTVRQVEASDIEDGHLARSSMHQPSVKFARKPPTVDFRSLMYQDASSTDCGTYNIRSSFKKKVTAPAAAERQPVVDNIQPIYPILKPSNPSRNYPHKIHQDLVYMDGRLRCDYHDSVNGCIMEYTGSISDEERQVHQAQSYGWPLNRGKQ